MYGEGAALKTGTPPKASEIKRVNDLLKYFKVYAKGEELTDWQGKYVRGFDMDVAKTEGADGHLNVQQVTWRITDTGNEDYLVPDGGLEKTSPVLLMKDD